MLENKLHEVLQDTCGLFLYMEPAQDQPLVYMSPIDKSDDLSLVR